MTKLGFVTSNTHKVEEVNQVLNKYNLTTKILEGYSYIEDKEQDIHDLVKFGLEQLKDKIDIPFIIEDTFLYFEAYNNFPGAFPKFVFENLGFKGVLKLLEGETREAYFKTVIGYCSSDNHMELFEGIMEGEILSEPVGTDKEGMDYDYIFQPKNADKPLIEMTTQEKNQFSQRGKASEKLANYLIN